MYVARSNPAVQNPIQQPGPEPPTEPTVIVGFALRIRSCGQRAVEIVIYVYVGIALYLYNIYVADRVS